MPKRNRVRDYRAEYRRRKEIAQSRLVAEQAKRRERLEILARAKHAHYVPRAETLYYTTPGQQRYWEQTYPAKIRAMSPDEREKLAKARGIDLVFPGWQGDTYPDAIQDAIAEYYLLGYMSRSRNVDAKVARDQANDLYMAFTDGRNIKPNWRAFRENYSRTFNR